MVQLPMSLAPFGALVITSILIPQASFIGHLSGILMGYLMAFVLYGLTVNAWSSLALLVLVCAGQAKHSPCSAYLCCLTCSAYLFGALTCHRQDLTSNCAAACTLLSETPLCSKHGQSSLGNKSSDMYTPLQKSLSDCSCCSCCCFVTFDSLIAVQAVCGA